MVLKRLNILRSFWRAIIFYIRQLVTRAKANPLIPIAEGALIQLSTRVQPIGLPVFLRSLEARQSRGSWSRPTAPSCSYRLTCRRRNTKRERQVIQNLFIVCTPDQVNHCCLCKWPRSINSANSNSIVRFRLELHLFLSVGFPWRLHLGLVFLFLGSFTSLLS